MSIAGTMLITLIDVNDPGITFLLLVICARGGNCANNCSIYVAHPKLFPTLFGVTSIGICNIASRSIVILAPIVAELEFRIPILIFTILSLTALLCSFFIVEDVQEEAQQQKDKNEE